MLSIWISLKELLKNMQEKSGNIMKIFSNQEKRKYTF